MTLKELYPLFWGCIPSHLNSQQHLFCAGKTGPKKKVLVSAQGFKMEKKWLYLVLELFLIMIKSAQVCKIAKHTMWESEVMSLLAISVS